MIKNGGADIGRDSGSVKSQGCWVRIRGLSRPCRGLNLQSLAFPELCHHSQPTTSWSRPAAAH